MNITRMDNTQGYAQRPDGTWERWPKPTDEVLRPPEVPHGGLDLDDDTPLPGGAACPLDGSCESCQ